MTAPYTGDPYESQLAAWAKAKIAAGADPSVVNSLVTDRVHAYRMSLATKPLASGPETLGDRAAGAISAGYQGLTLGAGNKITAGIRTVLPQALGGTKGFDFPEALREQTGVLDDFRQNHPIASSALELAGSVPTLLATGGAGVGAEGAEGATALQRARALAKSGAAYGAVSGALSANRLEDVVPGAIKGGAVGAATAPIAGAVGGAVARGVGQLARNALPGLALTKTAADAVGAGPATADERASVTLGGALRKGGVDPATAAGDLSRQAPVSIEPKPPTSMMELGSRNVQSVARQARNVPTSNAAQTIDRFLGERSAGAGNRIEDALTAATGHAPTDIQQPVEDLIAQRAEQAKPLYQQAEAYGQIKNPQTLAQIQTLLKNPVFKGAWERGQRLGALEDGEPATNEAQSTFNSMVGLGIPEDKAAAFTGYDPTKAGSGPTVQQINRWKKGLDATIESSYGSANALSRDEARVYRGKLNDVLDMVDREVPAFAKARDSFRGNSELMEAAQAGAKHFSPATSATYLQRTLPDMSDGEQEAYQANALNAFVQKVRTLAANPDLPDAQRGTNIVQRLIGTEDAGRKLRMLFPDQPSYDAFLSHMEQEARFPQTDRFLRQQSSTAAQLAESNTSPGAFRDLALSPVSKYAALRVGMRGLQKVGIGRTGMAPDVADAVGRQVTMTGQDLQDLLRRIEQATTTRAVNRQQTNALFGNAVSTAPAYLSNSDALRSYFVGNGQPPL